MQETGFNTNNLGRRTFWFCLGIAINAVGIAFITKAGMGTSQISSVPYVLTFQFPQLSLAMSTFLINFVLVAIQIPLLGREFFPVQLLQIPVNIAFSSFLGVSMSVFGWMNPTTLPVKIAMILIGCCILGVGTAVECAPRLVYVPGEGAVHAISQVTGAKLGTVKLVFDLVLVALAVALSLVLFGRLNGVGLGTIITVVVTGNVVNLANEHLGFLGHVRALAE